MARRKRLTFGDALAEGSSGGPADSSEPDKGPEGQQASAAADRAARDHEVVQWILECYHEAERARYDRMRKNSLNRDAYMGLQDWSYKQKGQSTEFLPKVATSAEQFAGFIKQSLIGFGDWFQVTVSPEAKPYITENQIRGLMECYLKRLPNGPVKFKDFETTLSDAAKSGLLESLIVLKVYGRDVKYNKYSVERGENVVDFPSGAQRPGGHTLRRDSASRWHLCIDLIKNEDYYPDPTGRGLYEIHVVERDYVDVLEMAKQGVYDEDAVRSLAREDTPRPIGIQENRTPQQRGQNWTPGGGRRKRVTLMEFWGTIIGDDGSVVGENMLATLANKHKLIRRPVENPLWHGESPFVAEPLIRVPHSVWHKALYDSASALNFALNEMFNLMLDGGIAAVWGIKQLRVNHLVDPTQIADGVPQGVTLHVKDTLPEGVKVLESVSESNVPQDGMAIFEMLDREFTQAAMTNDIKLGSLPQRQVKATEILQAQQSQNMTLQAITLDLESGIMEPCLRKAWLTILQHFDDLGNSEVVNAIGQKAAVLMMSLSEAERYALFEGCCSFRVTGLSATLAAAQDFQKLMAFFQAVSQNPVLMQSFMTQYDPRKVLKILMKQLNINPDDIATTPEQQAALPDVVRQIMLFAQLTAGGQGGQPGAGAQDGQGGLGPAGTGAAAPGPQGPFLGAPPGSPVAAMAGVNQEIQPLTGLQTTGG